MQRLLLRRFTRISLQKTQKLRLLRVFNRDFISSPVLLRQRSIEAGGIFERMFARFQGDVFLGTPCIPCEDECILSELMNGTGSPFSLLDWINIIALLLPRPSGIQASSFNLEVLLSAQRPTFNEYQRFTASSIFSVQLIRLIAIALSLSPQHFRRTELTLTPCSIHSCAFETFRMLCAQPCRLSTMIRLESTLTCFYSQGGERWDILVGGLSSNKNDKGAQEDASVIQLNDLSKEPVRDTSDFSCMRTQIFSSKQKSVSQEKALAKGRACK